MGLRLSLEELINRWPAPKFPCIYGVLLANTFSILFGIQSSHMMNFIIDVSVYLSSNVRGGRSTNLT